MEGINLYEERIIHDMCGGVNTVNLTGPDCMNNCEYLADELADREEKIKTLTINLVKKEAVLSDIYRSRSWRMIQRMRRLRRWLIPKNSFREKVAIFLGRVTRLSCNAILDIFHSIKILPQQIYFAHKVQKLIEADPECKGVVIQLPVVDWNWMKQRPHHLASEFARAGYLTLFCSPQVHGDVVEGIQPIGERLYLCSNLELLGYVPEPFALATYPGHLKYLQKLWRPRLIYDHLDDLRVHCNGKEPDLNVLQQHQILLKKADVLLVTANSLLAKVKPIRPDAILCPNGVNVDHFNLNSTPAVPNDLRAIKESGRPIIGYYGALAEWFDYELLAKAAQHLPEYEFVLIGPDYDSSLSKHNIQERPNIHWLGEKHYEVLPQYAHFFTVATIPFVKNEITRSTSPVKLFEYMAAGKPIVTTDLPECRKYQGIFIAHDAKEYIDYLRDAVACADDPAYRQILLDQARANSWQMRFALVDQRLSQIKQKPKLPHVSNNSVFLQISEKTSHVMSNITTRRILDKTRSSASRLMRHFRKAMNGRRAVHAQSAVSESNKPYRMLLQQCQDEVAMRRSRDKPDDYYKSTYRYHEINYWQHVPGWIFADFHEQIGTQSTLRCLDVGCAYGSLLLYCIKLLECQAYATDFIPYLENSLIADYGIQYKVNNIELEPFPWPERFDVILLTEVLEHFNFNALPTLRKLRGLLAENGRLYLTTPDASQWGRQTKYYANYADLPQPSDEHRGSPVDDHVWQFNTEELIDLVTQAGFRITRFDFAPGAGQRHFNLTLQAAPT
jgi:glycosyltransferase involved in cell wall biosynthesis/SAM-dependent methyltransferase